MLFYILQIHILLQGEPGAVFEAVKYAIDIGYRHVDAARVYGNEGEVGDAIQAKLDDGTIKNKKEIFITTKVCVSICFSLFELILSLSFLTIFYIESNSVYKFRHQQFNEVLKIYTMFKFREFRFRT